MSRKTTRRFRLSVAVIESLDISLSRRSLKMKELNENFHSREGALNLVFDEEVRVQYDGTDEKRIFDTAQMFAHNCAGLITVLAEYRDIINNDDATASEIAGTRAEVIEAWTFAQMALSRIGWCLRFDGNEAYAKTINSQLDSTYPLNFKGM
jgi:hypothetical protein